MASNGLKVGETSQTRQSRGGTFKFERYGFFEHDVVKYARQLAFIHFLNLSHYLSAYSADQFNVLYFLLIIMSNKSIYKASISLERAEFGDSFAHMKSVICKIF